MKTVRTSRALYYEVLKSFYLGVFRKGDRFLTYKEAQEMYNLSKQTLGVTYKRLQAKGFIRTEGVNGTIVTFDLNNPEHIAEVPFYRPEPGKKDINTYTVPIGILSSSLYGGLLSSDSSRINEYDRKVDDIIGRIQEGKDFHSLEEELILYIVEAFDNQYLSMIVDHFFSRYMYFELESRLSCSERDRLRNSAVLYYTSMKELVSSGNYADTSKLMYEYYDMYYNTGGALIFAKMGGGKFANEQTLYGKLIHSLYAKILEDDLKAGDYLPTIQQLCEDYGVSKTTVRKAYAVLAEVGLISSKIRDGTKLVAKPDCPKFQSWFNEFAAEHRKAMLDALEALGLLQKQVFTSESLSVSEGHIAQMQKSLKEQREAYLQEGMPYLISCVTVTPMLSECAEGILQKYFNYLTDVVDRLITMYFFRLRPHKEDGEEIYKNMCLALDALKADNKILFMEMLEEAVRFNIRLLLSIFEDDEEILSPRAVFLPDSSRLV